MYTLLKDDVYLKFCISSTVKSSITLIDLDTPLWRVFNVPSTRIISPLSIVNAVLVFV